MAWWLDIYALSKQITFIIFGLIGVGFIITFHELGHFLFCKAFKIGTPTFSIGLGPRILTKKIGDTEFVISAIPLGGYVEIAGSQEIAQGKQKEAQRDDEFSFIHKPYWQKMIVMGSGILFNLIFAYLAFAFLYFIGMPSSTLASNPIPVVQSIMQDSPAKKAGLKQNDKILAINGQQLDNDVTTLLNYLEPLAHQTAHLLIERNKTKQEVAITIGARQLNGKEIGYLGVAFETIGLPPYPFLTALKKGFETTSFCFFQTVQAFKMIFVQKNLQNIGGPLMLISQTIKGAERGFKIFLAILALISVGLAVLNLIPLPILDGGQALFYTIEAIIRRQIPLNIKYYIYLASWIAILMLTLYVSMRDIQFIRKAKQLQTGEQQPLIKQNDKE